MGDTELESLDDNNSQSSTSTPSLEDHSAIPDGITALLPSAMNAVRDNDVLRDLIADSINAST